VSALNVRPEGVVAVEHFPPELPVWLSRGPFERLRRASRYKRNPRDAAYMHALLEDTYGAGVAVVSGPAMVPEALRKAREVVLLWPDGNGFGWATVERQVRTWKSRSCRVFVLNGRRRRFELTPAVRAGYLVRRILERLWVGELAFAGVFVVVSPLLVGWDLLRGHH
jgi:hypothetical protein